jgi:hypothetical protein
MRSWHASGGSPRSSDMRAGTSVARGLALAAALASTGAPPVAAADPTTPPATRAPSCSERYPADGPAGVDLQLGCLVSQIVAHYTGQASPTQPTPLSGYLPQISVIVGGTVGLIVVVLLVRRGLGRRLAPVLPAEWWSCAGCRSVNAAGVEHCYRCGAARPPDAAMIATAAHPETPQAFGRDRRDG